MAAPEPWSATWVALTHVIARRSKDPSFKAGAVIVGADDRTLLGAGFNGPPPTVCDDFDWADRELKRSLVSHAESNALWFAVSAHDRKALVGAKLYVNGRPCAQCAKEIARAGIGAVIWDDTNPSQPKMVDAAEWAKTIDILRRSGTEVIPYSTLIT